MKRLILPVLLVAGLLFATGAFAQQTVKVDRSFSVTLTDQILQQKTVDLDISGLQFKDAATAEKFFHAIANNLIDYSVDYGAKKVTMHLYPERLNGQSWTVENWNEYMSLSSKQSASTYNAFNNQ